MAQWSPLVQRLPLKHEVPLAKAVEPGMQRPELSHMSPVVQGFPSHSRAPALTVPGPHFVMTLPEGSVPTATH